MAGSNFVIKIWSGFVIVGTFDIPARFGRRRTVDGRSTDAGLGRLNTRSRRAADGQRTVPEYVGSAMDTDEPTEPGNAALLRAIAAHDRALATLRYGSFRGIVRDGKLVRFAIEHEWRLKALEEER